MASAEGGTTLIISNVAWVRDHQHRSVLQLSIDGHPAHIRSAQKLELTRRGLVKGVDVFASEWRNRIDHDFLQGPIEPGLSEADLEGCTDDPRVFSLYQEMRQAIRAGTWTPRQLPQ